MILLGLLYNYGQKEILRPFICVNVFSTEVLTEDTVNANGTLSLNSKCSEDEQ